MRLSVLKLGPSFRRLGRRRRRVVVGAVAGGTAWGLVLGRTSVALAAASLLGFSWIALAVSSAAVRTALGIAGRAKLVETGRAAVVLGMGSVEGCVAAWVDRGKA